MRVNEWAGVREGRCVSGTLGRESRICGCQFGTYMLSLEDTKVLRRVCPHWLPLYHDSGAPAHFSVRWTNLSERRLHEHCGNWYTRGHPNTLHPFSTDYTGQRTNSYPATDGESSLQQFEVPRRNISFASVRKSVLASMHVYIHSHRHES